MVGQVFPEFPTHLKRRRYPQERREELQIRAPIPRVPQMSQSIPGKPVSLHCLDFQDQDPLTPRWHLAQPLGKSSRESHRSLDPREGKSGTAATAREESARAWPHSRRVVTPLGGLQKYPISMSEVERNPQVPAPTPHKVLGNSIDGRGIPRGPRATRMGTGFS